MGFLEHEQDPRSPAERKRDSVYTEVTFYLLEATSGTRMNVVTDYIKELNVITYQERSGINPVNETQHKDHEEFYQESVMKKIHAEQQDPDYKKERSDFLKLGSKLLIAELDCIEEKPLELASFKKDTKVLNARERIIGTLKKVTESIQSSTLSPPTTK